MLQNIADVRRTGPSLIDIVARGLELGDVARFGMQQTLLGGRESVDASVYGHGRVSAHEPSHLGGRHGLGPVHRVVFRIVEAQDAVRVQKQDAAAAVNAVGDVGQLERSRSTRQRRFARKREFGP